MSHQLTIFDVANIRQTVYKQILASSTADNKRLEMRTSVSKGSTYVLVLTVDGMPSERTFTDMVEACLNYNRL